MKTLGSAAKPFSSSLSELFTSLRDTGGLERLLDFIFVGAGDTNGYDALGHFLRAELVANTCLTYASRSGVRLQRQLFSTTGASLSRKRREREQGRREHEHGPGDGAHAGGAQRRDAGAGDREIPGLGLEPPKRSPASALRAKAPRAPSRSAARAAGTTYYTPSPESSGASGMLLNYLLGN